MIIRIMGEGQFDLDSSHLDELNRLDDELGDAIDSGDDDQFRTALTALLDEVRGTATPVADDVLVDSDLVLPYAEAHLGEVKDMLTDEGLIPDSQAS